MEVMQKETHDNIYDQYDRKSEVKEEGKPSNLKGKTGREKYEEMGTG